MTRRLRLTRTLCAVLMITALAYLILTPMGEYWLVLYLGSWMVIGVTSVGVVATTDRLDELIEADE